MRHSCIHIHYHRKNISLLHWVPQSFLPFISMKRLNLLRFAMLQTLPQKLNFHLYSLSWNTILLVMNYNVKLSLFEISKLLYLLHYQNWRKNWPELVFLLVSGHLVEFTIQNQHTNPSSPELYFEYIDHWWHIDNRNWSLDYLNYIFPDTWRYVHLVLYVRFWVCQGIWINLRPQMQWRCIQALLSILALQWVSGIITPDLHYIPWMCQVLAYNPLMKRATLANSWNQKDSFYIPYHVPWTSSSYYSSLL